MCDSTPEWKIEFTNTGKCFQYVTGEPTEEFTYIIESDFSPNRMEHTYVVLTTVTSDLYNSGKKIEYTINSLGSDKMTLETFKPKISYTHFTKQ